MVPDRFILVLNRLRVFGYYDRIWRDLPVDRANGHRSAKGSYVVDMKEVGIITYRDIADGKGRFLQAFALYSAIQELGYMPEIIDYYPPKAARNPLRVLKDPLGYCSAAVSMVTNMLIARELAGKRSKYEEFISKSIRTSRMRAHGYEEIKALNLDHDAFVCGSDQIWNPEFAGKDPTYYLQFAPRSKRIAYAPSLGSNLISPEELRTISEMAAEIPHLSIREAWGSRLISDAIGKPVFNVMDPTFLMPRKWWDEFAARPTEEEPYVLTFLFDNSSYPRRVAAAVAGLLKCKIISIPDTIRDVVSFHDKRINIGPKEFVSLFRNASFVCTQSLHGVILSLLYNRPFYVFDRQTTHVRGIFPRIQDLLEKVGLTDRILVPGQRLPKAFSILDFDNANTIIERERVASLGFLRDALNRTTSGEQDAGF
jgi:hypothetical protein